MERGFGRWHMESSCVSGGELALILYLLRTVGNVRLMFSLRWTEQVIRVNKLLYWLKFIWFWSWDPHRKLEQEVHKLCAGVCPNQQNSKHLFILHMHKIYQGLKACFSSGCAEGQFPVNRLLTFGMKSSPFCCLFCSRTSHLDRKRPSGRYLKGPIAACFA